MTGLPSESRDPGGEAGAAPPLLVARGVTWGPSRRPAARPVVGPVSLSAAAGDFTVLIGPNGAGKTSLLRLLAGLLQPDEGELYLDGLSYARLDRRRLARRIAYVPQVRPSRIPLTVRQVVEQGRYPHLGRGRRSLGPGDFQAVAAALDRVGLADLAGRRVDHLSGGERQAVFLAAALAQEAKVLVLDEPTTHLDPRHQAQVTRILLALKRDTETTVLAASHELRFAAAVADRVLALKAGRILRRGAPEELLSPGCLEELFEVPFSAVSGQGVPWPRLEPER